jgi:hypothetical protein
MLVFGKKRVSESPVFAVGPYELDCPIGALPNVDDLQTYNDHQDFVPTFQDESILKAPFYATFGAKWEVMLGAVNGIIYKIALCNLFHDKQQASIVAMNALEFCLSSFGKPSEQRTGFYAWDCTDGNVILQTAPVNEGFAINLFLTSSQVRTFILK